MNFTTRRKTLQRYSRKFSSVLFFHTRSLEWEDTRCESSALKKTFKITTSMDLIFVHCLQNEWFVTKEAKNVLKLKFYFNGKVTQWINLLFYFNV